MIQTTEILKPEQVFYTRNMLRDLYKTQKKPKTVQNTRNIKNQKEMRISIVHQIYAPGSTYLKTYKKNRNSIVHQKYAPRFI